MVNRLLFWLIFILGVGINADINAQQSRETFGRNRIQYKNFDWRYLSSENFDVYFYEGNIGSARLAINYLEEEFDRITDLIGYPPYNKTKVFLYSSVADLQQSNVGVNDATVNVDGQTKFVKSHVEIAHPGSIMAFKEELLLKVAQLLVNDMMFGGSLTEMFQSAYLLNLPEWFVQGASHYIAQGWNEEMDDYARELVQSKKVKKAIKLTGVDAAFVGHSIWNFIAENYGSSNISNILNYTRIIRNEEKSIAVTLGISFKQLLYEWEGFYKDAETQVGEDYVKSEEDKKLVARNKKRLDFDNVEFSPDGTKLAYSQNDRGKYEVIVKDLESGKENKVLSGGYKVINQEVDYGIPILSWVDDNTLGMINVKKGKPFFWLYDVNSKSKLPRELSRFNQVKSLDFSTNGRLGVVSADVNGQNDIFIISTRRERVKRLTNDVYDDIDAKFVPNTNLIVFSSNRESDTLKGKQEVRNLTKLTDNYNIFFYDLDTTKSVLTRVTNTISKDTKPVAANSNEIYYLSNQKGITNLFKYSIGGGLYTQVSNFSLGIKDWDGDFVNNRLVFNMLDGQNDFVYYYPSFDFDNNVFTPPNKRYEVKQAKLMVEKRLAINKKRKLEKELNKKVGNTPDTTSVGDGVSRQKPDTGIIDTDNYTFDKEVEKEKKDDSFLSQYRKVKKKNDISGPFPYGTRFSADNLVTSLVIDPLRGFGVLLEMEMNDQLENHRFYGGLMTTTDLRNGDIFAEYQYLKFRLDFNARYERNVILLNADAFTNRYTKNTMEIGAALPLNVKSRITFKPFLTSTKLENLNPVSPPPNLTFGDDVTEEYGGFTSEFVYDNSVVDAMNNIKGTKGKIGFKHYQALQNSNNSFANISLDVRHYQKIHKEITFATKLFYGKFFGQSPKKYLLGGMDNWLLNQKNVDGDGNPLNFESEQNRNDGDLLFAEFVTSLRGFDYAELFGTDVMLFNAELRVPVVRYLFDGPISSTFLRNLELVAFYDIGSSWTGISPFRKQNSVNTVSGSEGAAFEYTIRNFQNPWLSSYGAGIRTVLLGYYLKADLAFPVIDYNVGSPRISITLGYHF